MNPKSRWGNVTRVPQEFDEFLDNLADQISNETGYKKNKSAAMRQISKLKDRLVYKNGKWDWRIM